jgi:hypothetical protein
MECDLSKKVSRKVPFWGGQGSTVGKWINPQHDWSIQISQQDEDKKEPHKTKKWIVTIWKTKEHEKLQQQKQQQEGRSSQQ